AAAHAYERVAREHEDSPEAATAWLHKALVERDGLKRPEIARRDLDEVLQRYPDHPDAFTALLEQAGTLVGPLHDAREADRVLLLGVERWAGHPRAPELLQRAAEIEEKQLEDPGRAARTYERLATRFPSFEGAGPALFKAALLTEQT